MTEHSRTLKLPRGYWVELRLDPQTGFRAEWSPGIPAISSARARRKAFDAYQLVRDEYLAKAATMLGEAAGVIEIDDLGRICVRPAVRQ